MKHHAGEARLYPEPLHSTSSSRGEADGPLPAVCSLPAAENGALHALLGCGLGLGRHRVCHGPVGLAAEGPLVLLLMISRSSQSP